MKKIITVILTAVTLFGSMCTVMADSNSQPANKLTMPRWTVNPDRVTRVYNSARQSWEAKIVNAGNTNWIYPVMYYVPQELLDVSHTYTISAYYKAHSIFYTDSEKTEAEFEFKETTELLFKSGNIGIGKLKS